MSNDDSKQDKRDSAAPKVKGRRLSTALRAGIGAGGNDPPPDGTDSCGPKQFEVDGGYATAAGTWSCR